MKYIFLITSIFNIINAKINITLDNCYGNNNTLIIQGKVLKILNSTKVKIDDSKFTNLTRKLKETILNNAIENKEITIFIDKCKYKTKSDDEVFFEFSVITKKPYFNSKTKIKAIYIRDIKNNTLLELNQSNHT